VNNDEEYVDNFLFLWKIIEKSNGVYQAAYLPLLFMGANRWLQKRGL